MSLRIDTAELITGAYVIGETGLGVVAENIPSTGLHGASFLFNDLSLPADNGKEIRGLIVTPPTDGAFYVWEDGSFSLVGAADGGYTFVYRLYVDGVDQGTATGTISIGALALGELSGGATLGDVTLDGTISGGAPSDISGGVTLGDITAGGGFTGDSVLEQREGTTLTMFPLERSVYHHNSGTRMRYIRHIDPKDVDEEDVVSFDFSRELDAGESLVSADVSVEVYEGTDSDPSALKSGAYQISGFAVLQKMVGGVAGVTYHWRCVAVTSSRVLTLSGYMPVRRL